MTETTTADVPKTVVAPINVAWGDGEHRFQLKLREVRELEEKCNAGPAQILARLSGESWRITDLRETIRLGLIGGGAPPTEAHKLTVRYVDERPWQESLPVAQMVLTAALVGVPADLVAVEPQSAEPKPEGSE